MEMKIRPKWINARGYREEGFWFLTDKLIIHLSLFCVKSFVFLFSVPVSLYLSFYRTRFINLYPTYLFCLFHPAHQIEGGMEQRAKDSSHSQSSHPVTPSVNSADGLISPEKSEKDREDPDGKLDGRAGFHGTPLTDREGSDREGGGAPGYTMSVRGNGLHPSTAGEMDQSKPAEQQGGDVSPVKEKEAKKEEERDVEEAAEALEMEDEAEEEEEEKQKERDSPFCQKALPVETLVSEAEVKVQQLHQKALAEEKPHEEIQLCQGTQVQIRLCCLFNGLCV